jgi:excisionase family DNA binding protein
MTAPTAYYKVPEFADLLRVSVSTIARKIRANEIKVINVGSAKRPRLRVPASEVARAEKSMAVKA